MGAAVDPFVATSAALETLLVSVEGDDVSVLGRARRGIATALLTLV